ncbi:MAG TPA: Gfo/Idh/MocA family oxidoreductase [Verrucomicrobiae bacterium]|nr:Gfo/Idh/MocA family oxidoreductase [Verrucomicrobiae bacterium]
MKTTNRRSFIKSTAIATAAVSWSAKSWSQVPSANDDIRVAVIGFNGRGGDHLGGLAKVKGCRIAGLCDVDTKVLEKGQKGQADKGVTVEAYTDIRKLLESKNIDVVSVATPNHWHSLAALWAIQAGKDVYVEKPVSHNVFEGRKVVEAARKYQKIVQTGTQSRSSFAIRDAVAWVKAGNLGKLTVVRGLCYKPRPSIGRVTEPQPPPPEVNYDLWCGPAPMDPIRRKRFHYDWHWIWNYGNGDLGNQGIHQMDIARWFLGEMELSPRILSLGGRLGYEDDGETANTQIVYHEYTKAPLLFEVRGLPERTGAKNMNKYPVGKGGSVAVIVHCEGGVVVVPNYSSATAYDRDGKEIMKWSGAEDHYQNFIKAVRSRKHTDLNADILEGHLSSALCHTGNISYRLGQQETPDGIRGRVQSDIVLSESFERMVDHLRANDVDLEASKASVGSLLKMDPATEKFIGDDKANEMLTREYRKPFVVPEQV